jgi:hypothetical protein
VPYRSLAASPLPISFCPYSIQTPADLPRHFLIRQVLKQSNFFCAPSVSVRQARGESLFDYLVRQGPAARLSCRRVDIKHVQTFGAFRAPSSHPERFPPAPYRVKTDAKPVLKCKR